MRVSQMDRFDERRRVDAVGGNGGQPDVRRGRSLQVKSIGHMNKSHTYEKGCPEVTLTERQEAQLRRLWFVYGNGGPKQGHPHDHYFIQRFFDAGQDQRGLYPGVSQECLKAVDAVLSDPA